MYVLLAKTMYSVLRNSRIPIYLHRKSNHIFTVWQHIVVLLTIKQYERKSYRMFAEWLVEAHYFRIFVQLSKIPHFTTLQKSADRKDQQCDALKINLFICLYSQAQEEDISLLVYYRFNRIRYYACCIAVLTMPSEPN
jgi:hypothetical protein